MLKLPLYYITVVNLKCFMVFLHQVLTGYQTGYMHICSLGLTFSKTQTPFFTQHFLKVNTCPHFITDDLKILSIHNQTLLGKK